MRWLDLLHQSALTDCLISVFCKSVYAGVIQNRITFWVDWRSHIPLELTKNQQAV